MRHFASPINSSPLPADKLGLTLPLSRTAPAIASSDGGGGGEAVTVRWTTPVEFAGLDLIEIYPTQFDPDTYTAAATGGEITYEWFDGSGWTDGNAPPTVEIDGLVITVTLFTGASYLRSGKLTITTTQGAVSASCVLTVYDMS